MCQEGQHAGNLDDGGDLVTALSAELTDGQNGEGGAVVARSFCSSHLHGLLVDHHLCLNVTGRADTCEGEEAHNSAQAQGLEPDLEVSLVACALVGLTNNNLAVNDLVDAVLAAAPQLVPCDTNQEATGNLDSGGDDVSEGHPCEGVQQHSADVGHTGTTVNHFCTNGVLHPGVCNQNEECRNPGAEDCHEQRECVYSRLEAIPTEDPQTQEGRLNEEGEEAFHCQRSAEDVADEAGVFAPRHAELEFLNQTGGHTHCEVNEVQLAPELRHALVFVLLGTNIANVQVGHNKAQTQSQRNHEEVVDGGNTELPPTKIKGIH